jgi:hypothetical protein
VGAAFAVLALLLLWRERETAATALGALAAALLVGGLAAPAAMGPVYRAWMGLALVLSKVTTPIFLGIVYYLVLTPVGVLRRTFGQHPLVHVAKDGSFWNRRDPVRDAPKKMARPF